MTPRMSCNSSDAAPLSVLLLGHGNVVDDEELGQAVLTGEPPCINGVESTGNGGLRLAVRTDDHGDSLPQSGMLRRRL